MKIRPVGAQSFHEGGPSDMTKLIVAFRNFANAPKNRKSNFMFPKLQFHCNPNQLNPFETYRNVFLKVTGSQTVLRESQGIRDQLQGDL
jgi:hypothetical protein